MHSSYGLLLRCARIGVAVLTIAALSACMSATKIVRNDTAAIKEYHDVYYIKSKEDPRGVDPKVIKQFEGMGLRVTPVEPDKPLEGLQGTAFVITSEGHLLTCAHVLGDAAAATVWIGDRKYEADILSRDTEKDVAVLKLRNIHGERLTPLAFRRDNRYSIGEDVSTIGFPISNLLGTGARYSKGSLSAASGLKGNLSQLQISTQLQPGNSGGPLFDKQGNVLGIVNQTLNPWRLAQETGGALPQNVNFAIKGDVVLDYLKTHHAEVFAALAFDGTHTIDEVEGAVAKVRSGILPAEMEGRAKLVARVDYRSRWDMWYRFRYFVVSVYDFDSHDLLFRAGQGRDITVSDEDLVIADTFAKIKAALAKK